MHCIMQITNIQQFNKPVFTETIGVVVLMPYSKSQQPWRCHWAPAFQSNILLQHSAAFQRQTIHSRCCCALVCLFSFTGTVLLIPTVSLLSVTNSLAGLIPHLLVCSHELKRHLLHPLALTEDQRRRNSGLFLGASCTGNKQDDSQRIFFQFP